MPPPGNTPTFPAPAPPVQDAGDAQDVAQDKGSGWQIGALRKRHRFLFPARYPKPGSDFLSPAGARHRREGEGMGAESLPGETPKTSCLRLCLQLAVSCGVPGAGRAWDSQRRWDWEIWELEEGAGKRQKSERQAGSNIFPRSSRGQTSSVPPPPFPARWGETSSPQYPFPAPLEGSRSRGDIGGSSCHGGIAAASPSSRGAWDRHKTSANPPRLGDSQQRPLPADSQRCQAQPGSRGSGWDMEAALPGAPGVLGLEPAVSARRKLCPAAGRKRC